MARSTSSRYSDVVQKEKSRRNMFTQDTTVRKKRVEAGEESVIESMPAPASDVKEEASPSAAEKPSKPAIANAGGAEIPNKNLLSRSKKERGENICCYIKAPAIKKLNAFCEENDYGRSSVINWLIETYL